MPSLTYVDHPDRSRSLIDAHDPIAVDTEFMRERTYFAQLCLVQIGTTDDILCVDPLAGQDMTSYWDTMCRRTWVLHSARQDIEVIYQAADRMPDAIFDTQIAASLLGYQAQIGYAGLVESLFDVRLPKSHTRADWSRRPLSGDLLEYAAEDVEYLLPAYDALGDALERKGRLDWARADSAALLDKGLYDLDASRAVDRLKGARNLRGRRRAIAARLAEWREDEAIRLDRPRQWIVRDNVLIDIALQAPSTVSQLSRVDDLPDKVVKRSGKAIVAAIEKASDDGRDYEPPVPPTDAQKSQLKKMQKVVAALAKDLELAPETIASRKDLTAVLLGGRPDARVLTGWRRELIGDELLTLV